jgi:hypothetical protein
MTGYATLDHLVVAGQTLAPAVAHIEAALGVAPPPGGQHPLMATHNHVMQLGDQVFLEAIAPDPAAAWQRPRWFGLDDPAVQARLTHPRLLTWVARVPDLDVALRLAGPASGEAVRVSRGALTWRFAVPGDGALRFDGVFPSLIEWAPGPLPVDRMADFGCRLVRVELRHPNAAEVARALAPLITDPRISIARGPVELAAVIDTPSGERWVR